MSWVNILGLNVAAPVIPSFCLKVSQLPTRHCYWQDCNNLCIQLKTYFTEFGEMMPRRNFEQMTLNLSNSVMPSGCISRVAVLPSKYFLNRGKYKGATWCLSNLSVSVLPFHCQDSVFICTKVYKHDSFHIKL